MKTTPHPFARGSCRFLFSSLLAFAAAASRAAEPPAPLSSTLTGVHLGNSIPALTAHELWLDRDVDSILVFSNLSTWKRWQDTIGWLKSGTIGGTSGMFGRVDRPLVWSIPLFPEDGTFAVSNVSQSETRLQAEAAALVGSATVVNHGDLAYPTNSNNAVALTSSGGSMQFNNLPVGATQVRISYYAETAGTMNIMVNGTPVATVSFDETVDPEWNEDADPPEPKRWVYKEKLITGLDIESGDSIKIYSNAHSVFRADYIAFGNYSQRYHDAAVTINNYRPDDPVIYVRVGWEYNGGYYPWSAANGNASNYITAFRKLVDEFRAVSSRFRFVWCANYGSNPVHPDNCYPGDDYVDVVGLDVYDSEKWNQDYINDDEGRWNVYFDHSQGLDWVRRFASEHNKPFSIDEWGVTGDNVPSKDANGNWLTEENTFFIESMQQWMAEHRVLFHHYWDDNGGYRGRLRDNDPLASANQYIYSFSTPVTLDSGATAPPSNTSDEFDKNVPRAQWKFLNPLHTHWSLTAAPGRLRLLSTATSFASGGSVDNLVLQRAPDKDFEIVTRLYGKPTAHPQLAGLIVYADDDHYVRMSRKYENGANVFSFGKEVNGAFTGGTVADTLGSPVYLKIARAGSNYSGYFSADGTTWTQVWSTQNITDGDFTNLRVGFAAYGATGYTPDFDTFFVNKLEAEYGQLNGIVITKHTSRSGEKDVGSINAAGDYVEWKNVPGGSNLVVRYASASTGTKGLYIDGVRVQSINFTSTGSNATFANVTVNRAIPAGATLKLQHDSGDAGWTVDYVTLGHAARFEAEEAVMEGVTFRDSVSHTANNKNEVWGPSNDGAIRIESGTWGAVKFTNLSPGGNVTLRYRSAAGGNIQVYINGSLDQTVALPASSVFSDHPITVTVPAGGSLKLTKNNSVEFVTDYIVVRP